MQALLHALLAPFADPLSRTWWPGLVVSALLAALIVARPADGWLAAAKRLAAHPSTHLDVQLLAARQILGLLRGAAGAGGAFWLATRLVHLLDDTVGAPSSAPLPGWLVTAIYSLTLFVAWDLSRFLVHAAMHRVPALWAFHQVHHSAERLTPLTFHRVHPVESALYQARGALVTGVVAGLFYWAFRGAAAEWTWLGVPVIGAALNVATGNLRHSEVWLRFPAPVERWLLSPAQHQLHHSADAAHFDTNYGTWIAAWDRIAGTLRVADRPPAAFGIPADARNHGDDLLSAWFGPFRSLLGRRAVVAAAAAISRVARAEDAEAPDALDEGEIIVYDERGTPRVAGAAAKIDEETLERFEYNNIESIVSQIPGISTRGEDGYGLRPNIGIRGANSDRSAKITLMEDGVLLAPAPYAAPAAYYFPMSTRLTGVEVFKGPAATRHGPQTVGGALNVLTRPVPQGFDAYVDAAGGFDLTGKLHAWAGAGDETFGVLVEGVHLGTSGFKELDGGGNTGFKRNETMAKLRWAPLPEQVLQLKLGFADEVSNETYLGLSADDYEATPYRRYAASALDRMQWERTEAELRWTGRLGAGLEGSAVAYHHGMSRQWTKVNAFADGPDLHDLLQASPTTGSGAVYLAILRGEEDTASPDQAIELGTNDRRFQAFGAQGTLRWTTGGDRLGSTLEAGLRLHGDDVRRLHTGNDYDMVGGALKWRGEPTKVLLDAHTTAAAMAAHVHEDLRIGDLHVLPGARVEVIRTSRVDEGVAPEDPVTRAVPLPGVGVLYAAGSWVDLFAGSYRGFSPVAPGEAEEIRPETSWNHEAGLRFAQGERRAEVVGYLNDYRNLTGQCTLSGGCRDDEVDQQFNGGKVWVYGAELAVGDALILPADLRLAVDATYTLTESHFRAGFVSQFPQFGTVEAGDSLPYVARHQASARASLEHPRFDLGVGASWRTGMLDAAGVFPITAADVPAALLIDASASARLDRRLRAYTTVTNLTGSTALASWRPFGARPVAPLLIMVGVKLTPGPA